MKTIEIKNLQASEIEELDDLEVAAIVGGALIKGQVKRFNESKGFGFITPLLAEGQNVEIEI
ncbi:hypothetical protein [Nostoc sp. DedQUE07]|uniref:hypothetical protein n=1 Tax=Nostoc sp. DedQUE07 TaxID=3075392 RepID=UPI00391CE75A